MNPRPDRPAVILATINARYSHTAFGLRRLWAALGPLRSETAIREFTLTQPPLDIAESLLADAPAVIGFGVYIWNVRPLTAVVEAVKTARPETVVVLGGPEVSYEYEGARILRHADYLIRGEGERAFAALVGELLGGRRPSERIVTADRVDPAALESPYDAYTEEDIARRTLYVEASRGCPFRCEFCLSSLDPGVREFPLDAFLADMDRLLERGARRLKFVDRTFNLDAGRVAAVLDFFQSRWREGIQLHFEILPDRLTGPMLERLSRFPAGGLRLEVGVQSLDPDVLDNISRPQDNAAALANLAFLRAHTGAELHVDLVAGLPGESWEGFARAFDAVYDIDPHEIQVGILKRLKGAPIARHTEPYGMAFSSEPPYEVLRTDRIDFTHMQRIKRFARYFDLFHNSGNFIDSMQLLRGTADSPFDAFMAFADAIWNRTHKTHEFPLAQLARHMFEFLVSRGIDAPTAADAVRRDFHRRPGRTDKLDFLP